MLISPAGLAANTAAHARTAPVGPHRNPYGALGYKWAPEVLKCVARIGARSVLDYGAGKGSLVVALAASPAGARLRLQSYDPVTFPAPPHPADLVVCTDVLPFVEPDCLAAVLDDIARLARTAALIVVPQHPPEKIPGETRPGLLRRLAEWREILAQRFPVTNEHTILAGPTPRLVFLAWPR